MKIIAKDNGLFVVRSSKICTKVSKDSDVEVLENASKEDGNFIARLYFADYLMTHLNIQEACQLRLDASVEFLQSIDEEDEIEFDLSDPNTSSAIKMLSLSALDHYQICDFEMAVSLAETALEINPEDQDGMIELLGYSYAMLGDKSAVDEIMPFLQVDSLEKELMLALVCYNEGKRINISDELRNSLCDNESKLTQKTSHLWLAIPNFKDEIR